jgi:hypothetical protein
MAATPILAIPAHTLATLQISMLWTTASPRDLGLLACPLFSIVIAQAKVHVVLESSTHEGEVALWCRFQGASLHWRGLSSRELFPSHES